MIDIMYRQHGVERLEDLQLLTNDTLRDVQATLCFIDAGFVRQYLPRCSERVLM